MKRKNKGFASSLKNAWNGFCSALITEKNLRFDLSAALSVCVFGYAWGLGKAEWCALFAVIGLVVGCELVNTAIEQTVDMITEEFDERAKRAKDIAAAAPFFAAFVSVLCAVALFGDFGKIIAVLEKITTTPPLLIIALLTAAADILLIFGINK